MNACGWLSARRLGRWVCFATLWVSLCPCAVHGAEFTPADVARKSPAEIRQAIRDSRLSPAEIRAKLREAGYPENALDAYLDESAAGAASQSGPPASGAADVGTVAPAPSPSRGPSPTAAAPPESTGAAEPFGYEIFRYSPTTFEPLAYGPVDPGYPVGPGDELVLTLWGDDQLTTTLPVNREGYVILPEAGQVLVSGLTLEQVRSRLRSELSRVYSGLRPSDRRSTTFMDVSLGKLRSIQVFLLGNVVRPGGYTVSSVSRVLHALYAAGGPTRTGSLRDVRVMRNGRQVATADLYAVLLRGDASGDVRLQNGDILFLPPAGRRVTLTGPTNRQGIFELLAGENLRALLAIAGGLTALADVERALIERVVPPDQRHNLPGQDRIAIDVPLHQVLEDSTQDAALMDADRIMIFPVGTRLMNTVTISGATVRKPGVFEHRPGMTVRDLVTSAGGLLPDAYLDRAQVTRTAPDRTRSVVRFNLGLALKGDNEQNVALWPLDEVTVRSKWDLMERKRVSVHGMVRRPGDFEFLEGMTLADLLFQAGGLTDDAWSVRAEVARVDSAAPSEDWIADTLMVPLARDFANAPEATQFLLQHRDAVFVRRDPLYREQEYVTLLGEVKYPGVYALTRRDEHLAELVQRAGGLTELAYANGAVFTRRDAGRLAVDLPQGLRNTRSRSNLVLEPGDVLHVPRLDPTVQIEGAVHHPTTALYQHGAGVGYYIRQASGFRHDADKSATLVTLPNGDVRKGGRPEPGSQIFVPARPEQKSDDRLKDVATILSLVVSAATSVYLIERASR